MRRTLSLIIEIISLQSPRGRIMFFVLASASICMVPYSLLSGLSLWQRLGVDSPSIGLTRAYWQVMHFNFSAAWARNPLIFVVIGIGLPLLLLDARKIYKKKIKIANSCEVSLTLPQQRRRR